MRSCAACMSTIDQPVRVLGQDEGAGDLRDRVAERPGVGVVDGIARIAVCRGALGIGRASSGAGAVGQPRPGRPAVPRRAARRLLPAELGAGVAASQPASASRSSRQVLRRCRCAGTASVASTARRTAWCTSRASRKRTSILVGCTLTSTRVGRDLDEQHVGRLAPAVQHVLVGRAHAVRDQAVAHVAAVDIDVLLVGAGARRLRRAGAPAAGAARRDRARAAGWRR